MEAIENAYELNRHSHHIRGASTISQQVAKNVFLWSGRSYLRKALEAYYTVLIETLWPKRRILEVYLNVAEFGPGIYGAEAAAQHFFHEPAVRLTRPQAALLAAVLPNPRRFLASAPSRFVEQRREWIEGQMQALGGPEMLAGNRRLSGAPAVTQGRAGWRMRCRGNASGRRGLRGRRGRGALRRAGRRPGVRIVAEIRRQPALRLREGPALAGGIVDDLIPVDLTHAEIMRFRVREIPAAHRRGGQHGE